MLTFHVALADIVCKAIVMQYSYLSAYICRCGKCHSENRDLIFPEAFPNYFIFKQKHLVKSQHPIKVMLSTMKSEYSVTNYKLFATVQV